MSLFRFVIAATIAFVSALEAESLESCMFFMASGRCKMHLVYNDKTDLLYIRLDDRKQDVINRRVTEGIVLDIGENDRIIGIEIVDASKHVTLDRLLPVKYEIARG